MCCRAKRRVLFTRFAIQISKNKPEWERSHSLVLYHMCQVVSSVQHIGSKETASNLIYLDSMRACSKKICKHGVSRGASIMKNDEIAKQSSKAVGGKARATSLSPDRRHSIAKHAANARWNNNLPKATHPGEVKIGNKVLSCYVLEDGTRIFAREGFLKAMGRTGKPKSRRGDEEVFDLPIFLRAANLKPFISQDLIDSSKPMHFQPLNGGVAFGYKAELLPAVCEVFMDAREAGVLLKTQVHIAEACKLLYRGFATVGIIALVDEATGYQYDPRSLSARRHIGEVYLKRIA